MEKCRQTVIYVGLNDFITHEQRFETSKYLSILKSVCKSHRVPFSVNQINGGYFHEDGDYVEEQTLVLTLLDIDDDVIDQVADDLCTFFRQESVMVVRSEAEVRFVRNIFIEQEGGTDPA